jgi:2'-deoxynucleoside 5'-phosphate N-hydrolase
MKVYFSCSITGGRAEESMYQAIVRSMEENGHEVPTAHLSSPKVMVLEQVVDAVETFNRDMDWLRECHAVVAEVSTPSHGVGYEIAYALTLGKPVLCLYQDGKKISKILTGNTSPGLTLRPYHSTEEGLICLSSFLSELSRNREDY